MLELPDRECKITMTNMLRGLMKIVDNVQEQVGNASRELRTSAKNQKEMLEIKTNTIEMKNFFDVLISRLETFQERISEPDDMPVKTSQTEG